MSYTRSRRSVYSNIGHFNEGQLTGVKLEHSLTIITRLYRGLIFLPNEITYFFKFSADILFDHLLNSVFSAEPHRLENLYILENSAIT